MNARFFGAMAVAAALLQFTSRTAVAVGNNTSLYAVQDNVSVELNPNTGATINTLTPPIAPHGRGNGLAFSGSYLYFSSIDATSIYVMDAATGALISSFSTPSRIDAIGYGDSMFGPTVFTMEAAPNRLHLYNPVTGGQFTEIDLTFNTSGGMDFNRVTNELYVSDFNGGIHRLNPNTGAELGMFSSGSFYGIALVGNRLFTASLSPSATNTIAELDPITGAVLNRLISQGTGFFSALAGARAVPEPATLAATVCIIVGTTLTARRRRLRPADLHGRFGR